MWTKGILGLLLVSCLACESYNLPTKEFSVCDAPSADINVTITGLQVEFFVVNLKGDALKNELVAAWELGNGVTRTGNRFFFQYQAPGTYTVRLALNNKCDDNAFVTTRTITVR
jgi:PKD repeat protein